MVRKMLVGSTAALIGSPSHLSITASDGMSAPTSIAARIENEYILSRGKKKTCNALICCLAVSSLTKTDPLVVITEGSE